MNLYLSRIIGNRESEIAIKYFLSRTCAGSGRIFGYDFMTFLGQFRQIILIIMYVTRCNRLNLYLSRIIGLGI